MAQFQQVARFQYNMALEAWAHTAREDSDTRAKIVNACAHIIDAFRNHRAVSPQMLGDVADYWNKRQAFKCWEMDEIAESHDDEGDGFAPFAGYHDR